MTRRPHKFQLSQVGATAKQRVGTYDDRNQQITSFFKPSCKPERDVFSAAINGSISSPFFNMKTQGVGKKTPNKQRQMPALSPNRSPIMEAFLKGEMKTKSTVRHTQAFCPRCGMCLLSPRVVVKRLNLQINEGYKICSDDYKPRHGRNDITRYTPCIGRFSLSKTVTVPGKGQIQVSGHEHSPPKPFILVVSDLQAPSDLYHDGVMLKSMHQTCSLEKTGSNKFVSQVNSTSQNINTTSPLPSYSGSENGNSSLKRKLFSQNGSKSSEKKNSRTKKNRELHSEHIIQGRNSFSETSMPENMKQNAVQTIALEAGKSILYAYKSPLTLCIAESGRTLSLPEDKNERGLLSSNLIFSKYESNLNVDLGSRLSSPGQKMFPSNPNSSSSSNNSDDDFQKCKKETRYRTVGDSLDSDDESSNELFLSSDSEEEETLKPLDEILQLATKPLAATPTRDLNLSFVSLSQSPVQESIKTRKNRVVTKPPSPYINSLERLVKEKVESERLDEIEKRLHADIEMGFGVADEEMEDLDGELTDEHRDFLKKFTVDSNAIPDHPPGEVIFHLPESGKIFSCHTLDLKYSEISFRSSEESVIISCGLENQLLLAMEGYFTFVYRFKKCPEALMRWMFQMVSIHPSYAVSVKLLNTLIEITCNNLTNLNEKPWSPSLLDIATVFANMGVPFDTLFPLEEMQPSFSASDLVSAVPGSASVEHGHSASEQLFHQIPEFQMTHVIKFLGFCTTVYQKSFCDSEILALILLLLKMYLEKELKDFPCVVDLHGLLESLLLNIEEWEKRMPELCLAITKLSSHHHNSIKLLQLIPIDQARGREVRRHVSLMCIGNLLSGKCTFQPLDYHAQMAMLCEFMPQMKPSVLVKNMQRFPENESKTLLDLDKEAYYLTFSLLHLVSDASNSDESPSVQRKYLLKLCTELEKHIKSDIREGTRFFYRTKVKDLIARIHGRWQELLLYSQPNQGKLRDYWEPVCDDSNQQSSQEAVHNSPEKYFPFNDNG